MLAQTRAMQQRDISRVHEIELSSHRAPWTYDILSDCVLVGYDCRVLEVKGDSTDLIVGYIICRNSLDICHILNLCVDLPFQRKGYGQCLLQSVLDSPNANSLINSVILEVRPSNIAAITLYKKFGFYEDAVKKGYYNSDKEIEDAIIFKKIRQHP